MRTLTMLFSTSQLGALSEKLKAAGLLACKADKTEGAEKDYCADPVGQPSEA